MAMHRVDAPSRRSTNRHRMTAVVIRVRCCVVHVQSERASSRLACPYPSRFSLNS